MIRNIALLLSYDGADYHGWQSQLNSKTVQDTLNDAASQVFGEKISVTGCGRTDTGVSAKCYFASFRTSCEIPLDKIPFAINSRLPRDISVRRAFSVSDDFHPVHSCIEKEYTYYIYTSPVHDPFLEGRALHSRYELDTDRMKAAAKHFVGTHDFSAVRSLGTPVNSTVRTIFACEVSKNENLIAIRISANGFLYNMARAIAGTLLDVSSGKISPDKIPDILLSKDRSHAGATAPACGLFMTNVIYPDKFGLSD